MPLRNIGILIVDDFEQWRLYVRGVLEKQPGWRIVGEAVNGLQAIQKVEELHPEVVLLDVAMPILNGIEAAKVISKISPTPRIIFLSAQNDKAIISAALATGAQGYVLKSNVESELVAVIASALEAA